MDLKSFIKNIPDFPKPGIQYKDIQPLLENQDAFFDAVMGMSELVTIPDFWVGIESRGFIFASALSMQYGGGIKLIRKAGKLPDTGDNLCSLEYDLEYGSDTIQMEKGWGSVIIVDDVLATGGTIRAAERLATNSGYQVIDALCLLDIGLIKNHDIKCLISY